MRANDKGGYAGLPWLRALCSLRSCRDLGSVPSDSVVSCGRVHRRPVRTRTTMRYVMQCSRKRAHHWALDWAVC